MPRDLFCDLLMLVAELAERPCEGMDIRAWRIADARLARLGMQTSTHDEYDAESERRFLREVVSAGRAPDHDEGSSGSEAWGSDPEDPEQPGLDDAVVGGGGFGERTVMNATALADPSFFFHNVTANIAELNLSPATPVAASASVPPPAGP